MPINSIAIRIHKNVSTILSIFVLGGCNRLGLCLSVLITEEVENPCFVTVFDRLASQSARRILYQ